MRFFSSMAIAVLFALLFACAAQATVYEVGPGQQYPTIASVPNPVAGDTVNIHCGTYNEVRNWTSSGQSGNPITLRGVCTTGQPIIDGTGQDLSGNGSRPRAVWQIQGAYYVISNLAFQNGRNGNNGAGVRVLNTGVTISNVKITYCDMGFMTSSANATKLLVQNSEIAYNGTGVQDGATHNVYLTLGDAITFQFDYIHDAVSGTNFKSRAHYAQLLYSYITNGAQNEVDADDEVDTTAPNSNMTLIGNVIVSKPDRTLNTSQFINFGQDVGGTHNGTLYLANNTLVAGNRSIGFLRSTASNSAVVAVNNIFYGSNTIIQPGYATGVSGTNNWLPQSAAVPAGFTSNKQGLDPGFTDAATANYRLAATSSARNIGYNSPTYYDGNGAPHPSVPVSEYVHPLGSAPRSSDGSLDAGAYERATASASIAPGGSAVCNVHSTSCFISISPSGGQTVNIGVATYNSQIPSSVKLSDGVTNCTQDSSVQVGSHRNFFYHCSNVPSGITGITITTSTTEYIIGIGQIVVGQDNTAPVDVMDTVGLTGSGVAAASGTDSTTNACDIIYGLIVDWNGNRTFSQSGSWLIATQTTSIPNGDAALVYQVASSATVYVPAVQLSIDTAWLGTAASYRAASGTCTAH